MEDQNEFSIPNEQDENQASQLPNSHIPIEEIERRLVSRFNIEKDELKALGFDTEEKVRNYYNQIALSSGKLEEEETPDVVKNTPVDAYKLTPAQEAELESRKKMRKSRLDIHRPTTTPKKKKKPAGPATEEEVKAALDALNQPSAEKE